MDNQQKNTYVKEQITRALIDLLEERELRDISVRDITERAQVSRVSFYRNFDSKEDILQAQIARLIHAWGIEVDSREHTEAEMLGSLFAHFKTYGEFYQLLYKRGLDALLLTTILSICGPKAEQNNRDAYGAAFVAYGTYGWIREWFARGMTESAETMVALLKQAEEGAPAMQ